MKRVRHPEIGYTNYQARNKIDNINNNNYQSKYKPADFQLYAMGNNIYIEPASGIYGNGNKYSVWINGVTYNLDSMVFSDSYGMKRNWVIDWSKNIIDTTNGVGGIADFSVLDDYHEHLIWAIANDTNTGFLGFGVSKKPKSICSAISGGNKGGLAILTMAGTGNDQAHRYNVGAKCIVRNANGSAPAYEFCQGTIIDIPDNQTVHVWLDNHPTDGSSNITSTTSLAIEQLNNFRLSKGSYDYSYYQNARLIGKFSLYPFEGTNYIFGISHIHNTIHNFSLPITLSVSSSVLNTYTSTNLPFRRYLPPWARSVNNTYRVYRSAGATTTYGHKAESGDAFVNYFVDQAATVKNIYYNKTYPLSAYDMKILYSVRPEIGAGTMTLDSLYMNFYEGEFLP